jgi:NADH-quinone oxidoreductase subunit G
MVRHGGRLQPVSWPEALAVVAEKLKAKPADRIGVIAGDLQDAESMKAALDLFRSLGVDSLDCRQDGSALGAGPRESWLFNSTIAGLEAADAVLLIGTNPRLEAAVLNARLRKMWLSGKTRIGLIGRPAELTYDYEHLGENIGAVSRLGDKALEFARTFREASRPAIVIGQGALARADGAAVLRTAASAAAEYGVVRDGWNGWNVLHTAAARVGGLDLGFVPRGGGRSAGELAATGGSDVLVLLGADEIDLSASDAFVIYLGTHGDRGAHRADVILPGAAYTEKAGLYVNTEGRVQRGERAVWPKGEAKEDWAILRALSDHLGRRLPYDTHDELRARLFAEHPTFGQIGYAPGSATAGLDLGKLGDAGPWSDTPLTTPITQFHLTNPIARASKTMAECAALVAGVKLAAE